MLFLCRFFLNTFSVLQSPKVKPLFNRNTVTFHISSNLEFFKKYNFPVICIRYPSFKRSYDDWSAVPHFGI